MDVKARLRSRAFGWRGSHLARQRLKEAVTEIKKVTRADPVTAGDGFVSLMERIWPAFQDVDTSSGALGGEVYWAQDKLLPIAAPADQKTRDKWLDRLWQAIEDDGVDWITKYRYKILRGRVAERGRDLLRQICQVPFPGRKPVG